MYKICKTAQNPQYKKNIAFTRFTSMQGKERPRLGLVRCKLMYACQIAVTSNGIVPAQKFAPMGPHHLDCLVYSSGKILMNPHLFFK